MVDTSSGRKVKSKRKPARDFYADMAAQRPGGALPLVGSPTGQYLTASPPTRVKTAGDLISMGLQRLGLDPKLAEGAGRKAEGVASLTPLDTMDKVDAGDYGGALEAMVGGPAFGGLEAKAAGLSKVKGQQSILDMIQGLEYSPARELIPKKFIAPDQIPLNTILTPARGDRTMAGRELIGINGQRFEKPVDLRGGTDFTRDVSAQGPEKAIWASDPGVISTIDKRARKITEAGAEVMMLFSPMGGMSSDYAGSMTAKTILERMKTAKVTNKLKAEFDEKMRTQKFAGEKAMPDFPGIDNITDDWIAKNGKGRKKMAKMMDAAYWRNNGFPDMGTTRLAITQPELLGGLTDAGGQSITRFNPDVKPIRKAAVPHPDYKSQLSGDYVGGFDVPLPRDVMYPDWDKSWRNLRGHGIEDSKTEYAFSRQPVFQKVTPEWQDNAMKYQEKQRADPIASLHANVVREAAQKGLTPYEILMKMFGMNP